MWGDIQSIGETECIHSLGAEIFRQSSKVSPNINMIPEGSPISSPVIIGDFKLLSILRDVDNGDDRIVVHARGLKVAVHIAPYNEGD